MLVLDTADDIIKKKSDIYFLVLIRYTYGMDNL